MIRKTTEHGQRSLALTGFARLLAMAGLSTPELAAHELLRKPRTVEDYLSGRRNPPDKVRMRVIDLIMTRATPGKGDFTFIDLFAGIGGMRLGFEAAGGECVFTCEWDKKAQETYRANFGAHEIHGDIRTLDAGAIPAHDVLLAGFPCQPFSIAGVSKKNALGRPHGFACEAQGTLFHEVARIIDARRPAAFLLENVKNLQNHDRGNTMRVIRAVLEEELGYHISIRVIDGAHYVPQHRERIFIVGFREATSFRFDSLCLPRDLGRPRLGDILHAEDGTEEVEEPYTTGADATVNKKYILTARLWDYLKEYKKKHAAKGNGFGFGLVGSSDVARTLSARYYKDGSEILVRRGKRGTARPRRLTPRECARLMGFDDTRGARFKVPVSDTQAYRQFGNSVVVPVVREIARTMRGAILEAIIRESAMSRFAYDRAALVQHAN